MTAVQVYDYHCLCSQHLLSSTTLLPSLPSRKQSKARILPISTEPVRLDKSTSAHCALLAQPVQKYIFEPSGKDGNARSELVITGKEVVIAFEDGFETRRLLRCTRCEIVWGYLLRSEESEDGAKQNSDVGDSGEWREDVVYLLDGGVVKSGDWKDD